ncbi:thiopeptide-type bacteriocin biosynthesis protein [Bacillus atrophaeus]|uniref:thiopeptide-type bacteriocin biosynthesis protein n=1 Tax=Bacillus atrophaeus TaxID=1452 RepID=UPI00227DBB94|nr:thiopeptide-type bacteriocin biosynthesis protein [Bacillus atrophaeus]MCY8812441.1 thiopeptide-type bacteriocin biosynthesis protein [Bacillus atrophaeus]MCY8822391.1 thiopeptide-type bacteriocin biosynthesis protein [Bacillus atrophaeus]MCY8829237.1 thiopeptide-type bacteriocin biosynthesis protein [Bacillus atrophaeus]MCY8832911.1 thiopeptide-type bacteriocin biosynthesis protein [Bacillus atrophaeus]MEC0751078.1 thiopeptide-type bacteriocin biosynthesis protein [Bacillus atrophaeus]
MSLKQNWTSIHIFLHDKDSYDHFIQVDFFPFVEKLKRSGLIDKWFFIRYWEGGPHIRLRLLNIKCSTNKIIKDLEDIIREYKQINNAPQLTAETYYKNHKFDGEKLDYKSLPFYTNHTVKLIDYEPEYRRYGGANAIHISENLFHHSSEMVSKIISKELKFDKLLIIAIDLMYITAKSLEVENIQTFFGVYTEFWKSYIDDLKQFNELIINLKQKQGNYIKNRIELFDTNPLESTSNIYANWQQQVRSSYNELLQMDADLISPISGNNIDGNKSQQEAIHSIAISIIHMTNNRMGVTPNFEFILGSLLKELVH